MKGIRLQLHSGATNVGAQSGWQVMFWDVQQPKDGLRPVGKAIVSTDADGYLNLDISNVTRLALEEFGFLQVYKLDATDHEDSLVFAGRVEVEDIVAGDDLDYYDSGWERPNDWLPLPHVEPTEQKVVTLFGVHELGSNHLAFLIQGNYHVDWGDGTSENVNSNVSAGHLYNWSDIPANTVTSQGFRQVIVTITPQVGHDLTAIYFDQVHFSAETNRARLLLEIVISAPNLPAGNSIRQSAVLCRALRSITILSSGANSVGISLLGFVSELERAYLNIPNVVNMTDLLSGTNVSYLTLISGQPTNLYRAFRNNTALFEIPAIDCTLVTNLDEFTATTGAIKRSLLYNVRISHSYENNSLSAAAADEIYTNLADLNALSLPGATITMTGNPLTGHTPSIATDKGWTVTV